MASNRIRRIGKELGDIQKDTTSGIMAQPASDTGDLSHLKASFPGPPDTPYEGGTYIVDIKIPQEYPFKPPVMKFETKLWHPNVSSVTVCRLPPVPPFPAFPWSDRPIKLTLSFSTGSNMPRHPRHSLVPRPNHQIRPPLPSIPPLNPRTQRPPRCRSGLNADAPPRTIRPRGPRMVREIRRSPKETPRKSNSI